jgi:hypothetical protein
MTQLECSDTKLWPLSFWVRPNVSTLYPEGESQQNSSLLLLTFTGWLQMPPTLHISQFTSLKNLKCLASPFSITQSVQYAWCCAGIVMDPY